jgi:probable F420-dependent oxidoreductase
MPSRRAFRFGAGAFRAPSRTAWAENARRLEDLGYATLLVADHFGSGDFAPIPALTAAALATTSLRLSCTVFDNDFRHPALLAREAASLDLLSDGRLEFGIGAGYMQSDYDRSGIPLAPPGTRVSRMEEAVHLIKGLWAGGPFSFEGKYYRVADLDSGVQPVQRPHPPIFIGAGGKRLLSFAAREANIIGVIAQALPTGALAISADTEGIVREKIAWIREAAGERFDQIELGAIIWKVVVSDDPKAAAEQLAGMHGSTVEQILASPYYLLGSINKITEDPLALRERFGFSYLSIFDVDVEAFAPVVARLAGT